MSEFPLLLLLGLCVLSLSGFYLKHFLYFDVSLGARIMPFAAILVGVVLSTGLRDFTEAVVFLSAATAQFLAFVFVSRLRQRGSFSWHALAALGSNGTWFVTVHILAQALDAASLYPLLVVPYLAGIVGGRLVGAEWAKYIEQTFGLKADPTRDPKLEPGKRLHYIVREKMFWVLFLSLLGYISYGIFTFSSQAMNMLWVVVCLGILQNFFVSLEARARSRSNRNYAVVTSIAGGTIFFVTATYLFSKGVPIELFVPYVFSTALGSTLGAFFSMLLEIRFRISPDGHVVIASAERERKTETNTKSTSGKFTTLLAIGVAGLALAWLFMNEALLQLFGQPITDLVLPFPIPFVENIPRELVMLLIAPVFFLKNALHAIMSSAGSRNHAGYHAVSCVLVGTFDFFVLSYLALNAHILDIIPLAVFVGALGTLCSMLIREFIEKKLQAVMDVPQPEKS